MTPKPNPAEYTLCAWVEFAYRSLTALIDWCLQFIEVQLRAAMTAINAIYAALVAQMEELVDMMTDILTKCAESMLPQFSEDDLEWMKNVKNSFCEMLSRCKIVVDILSERNKVSDPSGEYWLDLTNLQSLTDSPYFGKIYDPYEWLRRVVCNFSLKDLIQQGGELTKEMLRGVMDDYVWNSEYGLGYARRKVEQVWEAYDEFIHKPLNDIIPFGVFKTAWDSLFGWVPYSVADPKTMNIFDLMAVLDLLADCAFSICNFATSVLTYKQDKKTKMFIDFDAGVPVPPTALTGVYKLNSEFAALTREWRSNTVSGACIS